MAIPEAVKGRAHVSALATYSAEGSIDVAEVARRIQSKFDPMERFGYLEWYNIARQAERSHRAGIDTSNIGTGPIPANDLPLIPATGSGAGRFEYRIVIIYRHPVSGDEVRTATTVNSNSEMSYQDLLAWARRGSTKTGLRKKYRDRIGTLGAAPDVSIEIISAGRTS